MIFNEKEGRDSLWLKITGMYLAALAGLISIGVLAYIRVSNYDFPGNAMRMPLANILIAVVLGMTAYMLFQKKNIGRYLFLVIAPWGSLALASAFPKLLWDNDIPFTVLAIFVYVPMVFLLARESTIKAVGAKDQRWVGRGGALMIGCVVLMVLAHLIVRTTEPDGWGMNEYIKRILMCDVPFWNYLVALLAVSIPLRLKVCK